MGESNELAVIYGSVLLNGQVVSIISSSFLLRVRIVAAFDGLRKLGTHYISL